MTMQELQLSLKSLSLSNSLRPAASRTGTIGILKLIQAVGLDCLSDDRAVMHRGVLVSGRFKRQPERLSKPPVGKWKVVPLRTSSGRERCARTKTWLLFGPFGKCDRESLWVCEKADALHGITSHLDGDNA